MIMIRHFLANHIALQTEFIINRSERALEEIVKGLEAKEAAVIKAKYYKVANSTGGMYPLVDYVNFKGEGSSPKEQYKGQGWGLRHVLEQMNPNTKSGDETLIEFVRSARFILELRVINSPVKNNEMQWLPGWKNRLNTYLPKPAVKAVKPKSVPVKTMPAKVTPTKVTPKQGNSSVTRAQG